MNEFIIIEVPGEPKPQARTKSRAFWNPKAGKWMAHTYDPKGSSADYRARITHEAALAMKEKALSLMDYPLNLSVTFYITRPKSKSEKKYPFPDVNPDIDNYVKVVFDALKGVVFDDDKRICWLTARKRYADWRTPATAIQIQALVGE